MNRFIYILGILFIFASCSTDVVVDEPENVQIVFSATVETKGTEVTTENLERFYVSAFVPELGGQGIYLKSYFEDVEFEIGADGNFYSNPPYYYPVSLPIVFLFYTPSGDEFGSEFCWDEFKWDWEKEEGYWENGCLMHNFSPNEEISLQCDLLMALSGDVDDPVQELTQVKFVHLLSQIEIYSKSESSEYRYEVAGVKLGGIASKANLKDSVEWDIIEGNSADYEDNLDTPIVLSSNYLSVMNPSSGNAFLLPQTLGEDAYIAVYLQVRDYSGNKVYPVGDDEYDWVSIKISGDWESSEKYEYKLDFTTWFEDHQTN